METILAKVAAGEKLTYLEASKLRDLPGVREIVKGYTWLYSRLYPEMRRRCWYVRCNPDHPANWMLTQCNLWDEPA